eukprot:3495925-Pleurochrysis_carterae.AAC.1
MNNAFKRWKRIIGEGKSERNGREDGYWMKNQTNKQTNPRKGCLMIHKAYILVREELLLHYIELPIPRYINSGSVPRSYPPHEHSRAMDGLDEARGRIGCAAARTVGSMHAVRAKEQVP